MHTESLTDDPPGLARAAALLRAGRLVAFATETVYGLGADATNATAIAALFEAKRRPRFNPLISHYATAEAALASGRPDPRAERLATAFWPGPLTLVLPRHHACPVALLAGAGLDTLAVRVPAGPVARALIAAAGVPIAAPSANRSGYVSPTDAAAVHDDLAGRIDAVLDSGRCAIGVESTVLLLPDQETPILLRPGAVSVAALEAWIGPIRRSAAPPSGALATTSASFPRSPGLLPSHYAPSLPVRLNATEARPGEFLLVFGAWPAPAGPRLGFLSARGDLAEAAATLFGWLRAIDARRDREALSGIAVTPIPHGGLGEAINDRLARSAAPRGEQEASPSSPSPSVLL